MLMTKSTITDRSALLHLSHRVNTSLERHFWRWASLFVGLFLACSIAKDLRIKMWIDELFTFYMAQQPNPAEIVQAIKEGCDGAPPLYAIAVHYLLPIVKPAELAVRLPSTLGYCAMVLFLLAFCRRRMPAVYSFIAALFGCYACLYYSTEGRPYGVLLGCAAGALYYWQMAAEGRQRRLAIPMFAFCLALMMSMHYYSVFFLAPLFLGEMARARELRKLDVSVLAAMSPALLVLALHYPLIEASKPFQVHFWSPATFDLIGPVYRLYLYPILHICALALVFLVFLPGPPARPGAPDTTLREYEWVAITALTLMPPIVIFVSRYTTHAFVERYTLWAVIGFGLLAGALLCRVLRAQSPVGVALLGILIVLIIRNQAGGLWDPPLLRRGQAAYEALEKLPDSAEAIVTPDPFVFMELSYYAEPRLRDRVVFPASRELDLHYRGNDTLAMIFTALARRTRIHVEPYEKVLAEHPRFILPETFDDYMAWHLVEQGYRVFPLSQEKNPTVFLVQAPNK